MDSERLARIATVAGWLSRMTEERNKQEALVAATIIAIDILNIAIIIGDELSKEEAEQDG